MTRVTGVLGILLALCIGAGLTLALLWGIGYTPVAYAATITVTTTDDELNTDGDCSLREAIAAANGDTAVDACVAGSGVDSLDFALSTPATITLSLGQIAVLVDGLIIDGPGKTLLNISGNHANRIFDVAANVPITMSNLTILDGDSATSGGGLDSGGDVTLTDVAFVGNHSDQHGGAMQVEGLLTITNSDVLSNTATRDGGGVYALDDVVVTNGRFTHNQASDDSGAMQVAGNLTMTNSDILSNTAAGEGGGIMVLGATTVLTNGQFINNLSGSIGGGIFADNYISISGTEFISNTAYLFAGAVWAGDSAVVENGRFQQNTVNIFDVGGMYVENDLTLTNSNFISNTAAKKSGALSVNGNLWLTSGAFTANAANNGHAGAVEVKGDLWISQTQFIANQASGTGGAIVHSGSDGQIVNGLFVRNEAGDGGSMMAALHSGEMTVLHNTIVGAASPDTTALHIDATSGITAVNNIFSGYTVALNRLAGTVYEDFNLYHQATAISGTITSGAHSFTGDPAFVDANLDNYHLTTASEAVNTGTNAGVATDADGDARPGGTGVDIGFDETTYTSDIAISKGIETTPAPGQPITYTLVFTNMGTAVLPRLTITDTLPPEITQPTISSSATITDVSGDSPYVWQLHQLLPGASEMITVSAVLADALAKGLFTNTVTIDSLATEVVLSNNTANASINIPNFAPIAVDDVFTTTEDFSIVLTPLLNDIEGDPTTIQSFGVPANGTAVYSGSQTLVYTPTLNFTGMDTLTYTVTDGEFNDTGNITITINATNDAPMIVEGTAVTVTMSEDSNPTPFALTLNATDAENNTLTWAMQSQAGNGVATAVSGPATSSVIGYTPAAHYNGSDTFIVQVFDGWLTDTIQVNVTIDSVNDAPEGVLDTAVALRDRDNGQIEILAAPPIDTLNVLENDEDVEDDLLTVSHVGTPNRGGTINIDANGNLQDYMPDSTHTGVEICAYTVSDGFLSSTSEIKMTVVDGIDGGINGSTISVQNISTSDDLSITIQIPQSVTTDTQFALVYDQVDPTQRALPGYDPVGQGFSLAAFDDGRLLDDVEVWKRPLTLTLAYDNNLTVAAAGPGEDSLALYYWNGSEWSQDGIQMLARDTVNNRLQIAVNHAGIYRFFKVGKVYMPTIMNQVVNAPDLIVEEILVNEAGDNLQIVIANIGEGMVVNEFWVDVYIDPVTVPTAVNHTWPIVGKQGLVWGIPAAALPLQPGERLTLTINDAYYDASISNVTWPLTAGTVVYAQVDSSNTETAHGGVLESHELTKGDYNNISHIKIGTPQ
ncbi:MAG: tandem-95 repeat protein [Chloroflexi bacterium]|nr:MAG: tandem-95 repeat protein [Chloroflexota bacterium]